MIPDINLFTNLGIAGVALFIIYMMLQYFMKTLSGKDEYIKQIILDFQKHIEVCNTNFMNTNITTNEFMKAQTDSMNKLIKILQQRNKFFEDWVKRSKITPV